MLSHQPECMVLLVYVQDVRNSQEETTQHSCRSAINSMSSVFVKLEAVHAAVLESVVSVLDLLQSKLPSCGTACRVVTDSQVFPLSLRPYRQT